MYVVTALCTHNTEANAEAKTLNTNDLYTLYTVYNYVGLCMKYKNDN